MSSPQEEEEPQKALVVQGEERSYNRALRPSRRRRPRTPQDDPTDDDDDEQQALVLASSYDENDDSLEEEDERIVPTKTTTILMTPMEIITTTSSQPAGEESESHPPSSEPALVTSNTAKQHPHPRRWGKYRFLASPSFVHKYHWGILGPHWMGPVVLLLVLLGASHYYIRHSLQRIGPLSASLCALWTLTCLYHFLQTCLRDPGIVVVVPGTSMVASIEHSQDRFCDFCQQLQPHTAVHCPDCQVCIDGYDHHCVWMGGCIGKGNLQFFVKFNLSWLGYLLYAILWCNLLGPWLYQNAV